jgi:hypothetical protein
MVSGRSQWQKPKTTKLYIQPPGCEKFITSWTDYKIVVCSTNFTLPGADAVGLLIAPFGKHINWRKTRISIRPDGIPIPFLNYKDEKFSYDFESFCSWEKDPTVFFRLKIKNISTEEDAPQIVMIPRYGNETLLMGINNDGYCTYNPRIETWGMIPSDWKIRNANEIVNDFYSIKITRNQLEDGKTEIKWIVPKKGAHHKRNVFHISSRLKPNKEIEFTGCIQPKNNTSANFSITKEHSIRQWSQLLNKKKKFTGIDNNVEQVFKHLTIGMLQMLSAHPQQDDLYVPRQGGIQRGYWPTEAVEFLSALDILGYQQETDKVYNFFILNQLKEGEDRGSFTNKLAPAWACITGSVLWGLGIHVSNEKSGNLFKKYKDSIISAFAWIKRTRAKTKELDVPSFAKGIFPPKRSTDWEGEYQAWCWTDAWNIMGLKSILECFESFNDPFTKEIQTELIEYKNSMNTVLSELVPSDERSEIFLPNRFDIPTTDPPWGPYFGDGPSQLIRAGIIEPNSDLFIKIENYFKNRGLMSHGLTGLMTDSLVRYQSSDPWAGHTWYLSLPDMAWYFGWIDRKDYEKAKQTMKGMLQYGMTTEYIMQERYADNDDSFVPWQPNASANGRTVMMLLDYCKRFSSESLIDIITPKSRANK